MIDEWTNDVHQGDVLATLREMPESSVHMAMCSPPYYGLRDYGDETITVWAGDEECDHHWSDREVYQDSPIRGDGSASPGEHDTTEKKERWREVGRCVECGARREQLGLEEDLNDYIEDLVAVGEEIRRVLRPDGSWWLNLGDSFASSWGAQSKDETSNNLPQNGFPDKNPARQTRLKRKCKMLIPHRVAIALQDAGWVVRSDAVWAKPNPMPHPVKDRFREDKEFVFHLTPEPDYWFDLDAVREPHKEHSIERSTRKDNRHEHSERQSVANEETLNPDQFVHPAGKNPGDILEVTVQPFPDAHFAVYPPELVRIPLRASCPPTVCAECGTPYERVVDRTPGEYDYTDRMEEMGEFGRTQASGTMKKPPSAELKGWEQACECDTEVTEPGIVLDPFAGAGTTCLVAKQLGRRFVGVDLNPEYVAMAQKRVGVDVDQPELLLEEGQETLADGGFGFGEEVCSE